MVAFLKSVSFNKADFHSPPLDAIDIRTGQHNWAFEKDLQQEDCRMKLVSEGGHALVVSLREAREGDLRAVFTVYSENYSLITREEISFPSLVAEYEAHAPLHQTPFSEPGAEESTIQRHLPPSVADQIRGRIDPLLRQKIGKWMLSDSSDLFKTLAAGLVRAIWDMRQSREKFRRLEIRATDEKADPFGGKHRTYHEHRSS